jgi:hypothetical protein
MICVQAEGTQLMRGEKNATAINAYGSLTENFRFGIVKNSFNSSKDSLQRR